jgi:TrmH family RNA methyltransferase
MMNLQDLRKLHHAKHRETLGSYLVEGEHLVLELEKAARSNPQLRDGEIYVSGAYEGWQSTFPVHPLADRQMAQITETRTPPGIIARVPRLPPPPPRVGERAIWLHEIQDPGNLGTILRGLAWFGGFRCLLGPDSVDPHNAKAIRASMGAIFHVPVETDVHLETLAKRFARIAWLDMQGEPVHAPAFRDFDAYVFGNEARGAPREALAALGARPFTIPGNPAIDSLNVAAAVNMSVYELHRGREG